MEDALAKFYYGGEAGMGGVMMRGQRHMAVAVRAPSGEIVVHEEALDNVIYRNPTMKLPFLRGLVALWDALGLGMKALMFSANVALEEEGGGQGTGVRGQEATDSKQSAETSTAPTQNAKPKTQDALGTTAWVSIAIALAVMVAIFFLRPVLAASLIAS